MQSQFILLALLGLFTTSAFAQQNPPADEFEGDDLEDPNAENPIEPPPAGGPPAVGGPPSAAGTVPNEPAPSSTVAKGPTGTTGTAPPTKTGGTNSTAEAPKKNDAGHIYANSAMAFAAALLPLLV